MSTNDVPGARAQNEDELAMGCWAEHEDGSLIFVENTEGDQVIYSMFDLSREPIMEWRDAMEEDEFKTTFSYPGKSGEKWTWHDKTPFPWDRVIENFPQGARHASVNTIMTAAQRVAERLGLRGRRRSREDLTHMQDDIRGEAEQLISRLQRVIERMPS